ncbi:hypothetical protein ACTXOR_04540 [Arthrobacter rhombi]|uniref:hypothetical protein n=1 Tax=Arthrobacter rhombi TaxID=71253 RepID=UPI003FD1168D
MEEMEPDTSYTTIEGVPYVRLFVDHGESPVWTWEPVAYEELALPAALEARMRVWETEFTEQDIDTTSTGVLSRRHRAEGILIAGQLAGELGSPLAVHYAPASPEESGGSDALGHYRPSLADPEVFHVETFPLRPVITRRLIWMLQHPFELPEETAGSSGLDADWSDLEDIDDQDDEDQY